jgi:hypothetical protein
MTNKDIVKQYVDTGMAISKYQVNKLTTGLLNTYIRKRLIASKIPTGDGSAIILTHEYLKMDNNQRKESIPFVEIEVIRELDYDYAIEFLNRFLDYKRDDLLSVCGDSEDAEMYYYEVMNGYDTIKEIVKYYGTMSIMKKIINNSVKFFTNYALGAILDYSKSKDLYEIIKYFLDKKVESKTPLSNINEITNIISRNKFEMTKCGDMNYIYDKLVELERIHKNHAYYNQQDD